MYRPFRVSLQGEFLRGIFPWFFDGIPTHFIPYLAHVPQALDGTGSVVRMVTHLKFDTSLDKEILHENPLLTTNLSYWMVKFISMASIHENAAQDLHTFPLTYRDGYLHNIYSYISWEIIIININYRIFSNTSRPII